MQCGPELLATLLPVRCYMCLTPTGPQYCSLRGFTVTSSSHAYTSKRLALSPSLAGFQLVVDELVRKKRGEPLRKPSDRERKPRPQLRRRMSAWGWLIKPRLNCMVSLWVCPVCASIRLTVLQRGVSWGGGGGGWFDICNPVTHPCVGPPPAPKPDPEDEAAEDGSAGEAEAAPALKVVVKSKKKKKEA